MDITLVIAALKSRCSSFGNRVAGAAEFTSLPEKSVLPTPAAFVIPMDDDAQPNKSDSGYLQEITDIIAVVVAIDNTPDERGQTAIYSIKALRAELWAALLGWEPDSAHGHISYIGGHLLRMDRARLFYQFEFSAVTEIDISDTWQGQTLAALPAFTKLHIDVDAIDPHDPNVGATGPDGKKEAVLDISIPQ